MADRKVLGKYYPPDFDPEKLAQKGRIYRSYTGKRGKGGEKLMNVRFMFPFTMCCSSCNEFIYVGTKFNSRVEKVKNEEYLGTPVWRFHARCPHCRASIMFKTDPKHTEYILESGGVRTYDPRKDADLAEMTIKEKIEEEMTDSIRALEYKTYNTAKELVALEQLDELRKINKRLLNRESIVESAVNMVKKKKDCDIEKFQEFLDEQVRSFDAADFQSAQEEMNKHRMSKLLESYDSDSSSTHLKTVIKDPDLKKNDDKSNLNIKSFIKVKKKKK